MTGYSDRINHALAFAAKHHDQLVRRGTRAPYFTQPANLAVILTRYDRDEEIVAAAILLEVVEDYARQGHPRDWLDQRIGQKFGSGVLDLSLGAAERRSDDDGAELSVEERRTDVAERMSTASDAVRWIAAAAALHAAGTLLADLRRTVEAASVWNRLALGRQRTVGAWRLLHTRLASAGFTTPIVTELGETISALESFAA